MKYTLPNQKVVNIPDKIIEKSMKNLEISKDEAIEMWLEDEGYFDNEEQLDLEQKAKDSGIMRTIHKAKDIEKPKEPQKKERKVNSSKALIVQELQIGRAHV